MMANWRWLGTFLKRGVSRSVGALGYAELADRLGLDGLHAAIWDQGNLRVFLLIAFGISILVDLFIFTTSADS
jgi:hypothetical protein